MLPLSTFESMYGRRQTMVISVKMPTAEGVAPAMLRAEEAMRIAHRLRPGTDNDFTIDTGEGLIAFWGKLTRVIFTVVPAVVVIGIVVGGIVIMNIMLMSVTERTREIGIRKALGAASRDIRRQFFAEALTLSVLGGIAGLAVGTGLAGLVQLLSPLPARVTLWSIGLALLLGIVVGVAFVVYPAQAGRAGCGGNRATSRNPLRGDLDPGVRALRVGRQSHPHPRRVRRRRPLHGDSRRRDQRGAVVHRRGAARRRSGRDRGAT